MTNMDKELDFLHEVAKKISVRSEQGSPILPEEVFDLIKVTFESLNDVRIVEMPLFMPFIIEKEEDYFSAKCHPYRLLKGRGVSEEEAIQDLKEKIEFYNKGCLETERKSRIEETVRRLFPKNFF